MQQLLIELRNGAIERINCDDPNFTPEILDHDLVYCEGPLLETYREGMPFAYFPFNADATAEAEEGTADDAPASERAVTIRPCQVKQTAYDQCQDVFLDGRLYASYGHDVDDDTWKVFELPYETIFLEEYQARAHALKVARVRADEAEQREADTADAEEAAVTATEPEYDVQVLPSSDLLHHFTNCQSVWLDGRRYVDFGQHLSDQTWTLFEAESVDFLDQEKMRTYAIALSKQRANARQAWER